MSNLKLMRFLSGEDVLGEMVSQTPTDIRIKNPVRVVIIQSDPRSPRVGFGPWCEFSKEKEFLISKQYIVFISDPIDELANHYNKTFGKIITPNNILIPGSM